MHAFMILLQQYLYIIIYKCVRHAMTILHKHIQNCHTAYRNNGLVKFMIYYCTWDYKGLIKSRNNESYTFH